MRISTVTMFESSLASMNRQQGEFMKVGQQIASGRRVVNPSDDPQAASRAVGVSQSMAVSQQYSDARVSARNALSQEESVLNSVSDSIASAKTRIIQAQNDTLSDVDRASIAADLEGIYENLLGQANVTNGNGTYLFAGYKDDAPPFVKEDGNGPVSYQGDLGVRKQQVDSSREMPVGNSGKEVFGSVDSSNQSIFTTLESAIDALKTPADADDVAKASLRKTLSTVSGELDNSLDNVLTVRASVGARLNELDMLDDIGGNRMLNYEQTMSDLVDLDYARAISDYTLRQVGLQASQKAFVDIQGMSLFDQL